MTALGMEAVSFCDTLHFWRSQPKISFAKDLADSPARRETPKLFVFAINLSLLVMDSRNLYTHEIKLLLSIIVLKF
jgi:hypothetical protein